MSREPERWELLQLRQAELGEVAMVVTPPVLAQAQALLGLPVLSDLSAIPDCLQTLVVVGGGSLIDQAKLACRSRRPGLRLIAVPSRWGSGAEVSPVAVFHQDGRKQVAVDAALVPDAWVVVPELAASLDLAALRAGCGDAWAHAYEALMSPLADADLRVELARLVVDMLALGLGADPRWFDLSARACGLQVRASVGLVHGMAQVLEPALAGELEPAPGHAELCATLLAPVHAFNLGTPGSWDALCRQLDLDAAALARTFAELHDVALYQGLLPALKRLWTRVLREPMTRTNGVLVRPGSLDFFLAWTCP